jgi:predicted  nucleic acid-binding Zn-ribbon protein
MSRIAVALACIAALAIGGCGVSTGSDLVQDAEDDWAKELESTITDWREKGGEVAQEEIVKAKTATGLEIAYISYATELTVLRGQLETIQTPEACQAIQNKVTGFVRDLAAITRELGNQTDITEAEFREIVEEQNALVNRFANLLSKIQKQETCET